MFLSTGANWVSISGIYWATTIQLPSSGLYYLSNPSIQNWSFGAVYYAVSGTTSSELPNGAFPLGYDMTQLNDLPLPTLCPRCQSGIDCAVAVIHTCACNPCRNFDDECIDNPDPREERICRSTDDTTGNHFTLMYMQNRPDNTVKRELVGSWES